MAQRRRSIRRFSRGTKQYLWVTTLKFNSLQGTTPDIDLIVTPNDWALQAAMQKGAKLEAIRGWYSYGPSAPLSEDSSLQNCFMSCIGKTTVSGSLEMVDDPASYNPMVDGFYDEADLLWTDGCQIVGGQSTIGPSPAVWHTVQLNVPVKRKLTSQDVIYWLGAESTASSLDVYLSACWRCLISIP